MHLYASLILPIVTAALAAGTCSVNRDPKHPTSNRKFICGRQGALGRPMPLRTFHSINSDPSGCADSCFSQPDCLSFSYTPANNICQTYRKPVRSQIYRNRGDTGDFFYYKMCYIRSGNCGLANPGFDEDSPAPGDDPSAPGTSPNVYLPWEFFTTGSVDQSMIEVVDNDSAEFPSQDGSERFAEITLTGANTATLTQDVTLQPSTNYTIGISQSLQSYMAMDPNTYYTVTIRYGDDDLLFTNYFSGSQAGVWSNRSKTFISRAKGVKKDGTTPLSIIVTAGSQATEPGEVDSVSIGIDALSLEITVGRRST